MNELVKEIVLTRAVNQMLSEVKGAMRRGEKEIVEEGVRKARRAYNSIRNRAYVNGLREREMTEEVKEELSKIGGLSKEEIEDIIREEREVHRKLLGLWEAVKEEGQMEVEEALKLLNESSREALKKTGLKLLVRGNEAGIELLALVRTD
jgi:Na+/phosphate symporter